jgi:cytoskeletal protein CcmA (bactofilin family)
MKHLSKEREPMRLRRRTLDKLKDQHTTVISEGIQLKGEMKGTHTIILYGEFKGNIRLSGTVLVGRTGRIKGEIEADNVIIEGEVEGKITATEKVEIRDDGKYRGDILAASVLVSQKAVFEANVKMRVEGEEPSVQRFTEKRGAQLDDQ